jgi:hypothetical protein
MASREGATSTTTTALAPAPFSAWTSWQPIGPAPKSRARDPGSSRRRFRPQATQATGSTIAPSAKLRSPMLTTTFSGTARYSAKAPSRLTPTTARSWHWLTAPRWHSGQRPQGRLGSAVTRSPTRWRRTFAPTATIVPANSWPGISGKRASS